MRPGRVAIARVATVVFEAFDNGELEGRRLADRTGDDFFGEITEGFEQAVVGLVVFVEVDGLQKLQPLRRPSGGGLFRWEEEEGERKKEMFTRRWAWLWVFDDFLKQPSDRRTPASPLPTAPSPQFS